MYSQRCPRTKRQLVCIFKHPVTSSYSADTDTTMHFKAHCLSSGPFMIMQPAIKNPCQSCIRRRRIIRPQSISRLLFHNLSQSKCVFQNCTDCLYCTIKHRRYILHFQDSLFLKILVLLYTYLIIT